MLTLLTVFARADEDAEAACERWLTATGMDRLYPTLVTGDGCPGLADHAATPYPEHATYRAERPKRICPAAHPSLEDAKRSYANCFLEIVVLDDGETGCSGALVAPDVVLTAGHCVGMTRARVSPTLSTAVWAEREVVRAERHPDRRVDLALLRLEAPVNVDPLPWATVRAARLPDAVFVYGFGATAVGSAHFGVSGGGWFIDDAVVDCTPGRAAALGCRPGQEFVLFDETGRDTAAGDSGGPVLEPMGAGWRIVGVTSRSLPGGGVGDGGVYQRVDVQSAWILETIRSFARVRGR